MYVVTSTAISTCGFSGGVVGKTPPHTEDIDVATSGRNMDVHVIHLFIPALDHTLDDMNMLLKFYYMTILQLL